MMPFKLCGEAKVAQSHYGGEGGVLHDSIRQSWYQKLTQWVMSQVLAVSYFCDWTFKRRLWWSNDECACSQFGWPTMSAYIITVWTTAPASLQKKEKKQKAKGTCEWCSVMTSECMAVCVQVGGWTVALRCCLCSGDSKLRIKCAALRNKVLCFGSALTLSLLNEKCVYICTHAAQRYSCLK